MLTPRPYLSFSQMTKFEMSPEEYVRDYIYGQRFRPSKNMLYGSALATGLEDGEATGDPLLDLMAARLPKLERMDLPVEDPKGFEITFREGKTAKVPVLKTGNGSIPILALPDTSTADYTAFKEYKTSVRKWTQKMADQSGQITFYATAIWLARGYIPKDIELVNIQTAYDEYGGMTVTGEIYAYKTERTMVDVIKMTRRMKDAWAGIGKLCERELI